MTSIKEIFSFSESELDIYLKQYEDISKYSNLFEKRNAVLILAYNHNHLNKIDNEIIQNPIYEEIMIRNPKTYEKFIEFYNKNSFSDLVMNFMQNKEFNRQVLSILKNKNISTNKYLGSITLVKKYCTFEYQKGYDGYTRLSEIINFDNYDNYDNYTNLKIGVRGYAIFEDGTEIDIPYIREDGNTENKTFSNVEGKKVLFFDSNYRS